MLWERGSEPMCAPVIWNGTEAEASALLAAIARFCTCRSEEDGAWTALCASHEALAGNQRFPDGLLFGRRIAHRLIAEEWRTGRGLPATGASLGHVSASR
jgi:hypothetical protein